MQNSSLVNDDQDYITLFHPKFRQYCIPKHVLRNRVEVARWIDHLSEKSWVTLEMLQDFKKLAINAIETNDHCTPLDRENDEILNNLCTP